MQQTLKVSMSRERIQTNINEAQEDNERDLDMNEQKKGIIIGGIRAPQAVKRNPPKTFSMKNRPEARLLDMGEIQRMKFEPFVKFRQATEGEQTKRTSNKRMKERMNKDVNDIERKGIEEEEEEEGGERVQEILFKGSTYVNGRIYKQYGENLLQTSDINPTLDEMRSFSRGDQFDIFNKNQMERDESLMKSDKQSVQFERGDRVIVIKGGLKYLEGEVINVEIEHEMEAPGSAGKIGSMKQMVSIQPHNEELKQPLLMEADELSKYFKVGDNVIVNEGQYKGLEGQVVEASVRDDTAKIFSETAHQEISVRGRQLSFPRSNGVGQIAGNIAAEQTSNSIINNCDQFDLVELTDKRIGCVIKVDQSGKYITVMSTVGDVYTESMKQLIKVRDNKRKRTLDNNGKEIGPNDEVRIMEEGCKYIRCVGVVKQIFASTLFLTVRENMDNNGLTVVQSGNCQIVFKRAPIIGDSGILQSSSSSSSSSSSQSSSQQGNQLGRRIDQDPMLYKDVQVTKGPFKGYRGMIKKLQGNTATVELHTKPQPLLIEKQFLLLIEKQEEEFSSSSKQQTNQQTQLQQQQQNPLVATPWLNTPIYSGFQDYFTPGPGGYTPFRSNTYGYNYQPPINIGGQTPLPGMQQLYQLPTLNIP
ncbi:MAG: putative Supt5 repeat protein, partial [Streblomastix strix]